MRWTIAVAWGVLASAVGSLMPGHEPSAQPRLKPPAPAPAAVYQAILRYRIIAPRDEHAGYYDRLVDRLQAWKFNFQPPLAQRPDTDRFNPDLNEFRGTIAAEYAFRLHELPFVAGVLLIPAGLDLDKIAPDEPVRVRIEIVPGLPLERQRDLVDQAKLLLGTLGFVEAVGYDHHGDGGQPLTRLIGTIPRLQLPQLLKDLRDQPNGWLAPRIERTQLPPPLRFFNPIRYTEVLADTAALVAAAEPTPRQPDYLEKIGPGLWELINDKDRQSEFVRVQVIFAGTPSPAVLRQRVRDHAPNAFVEGILGSFVTAELPIGQVKNLAALVDVVNIRLPIPASGDIDPSLPGEFEPAQVLATTGLAQLHQRGARGQGVRVAIVDADFRGWTEQVKAGTLT
ncbi:MAG: hypothetical protein NZO58_05335, partial [Gemmataceae bacterium]|nr:hypothetical protein [Gemmataceae bacterium]